MLRGQKAILRPVKRSDISCFLKWFNDPDVIQYLVGYLPMTEMAEEKWIEEQAITTYIKVGNSLKFIIEAIEDSGNKPIGDVCIFMQNQQGIIELVLYPLIAMSQATRA